MENFSKLIPKVLIPILLTTWVCVSICDGGCDIRVGGVCCVEYACYHPFSKIPHNPLINIYEFLCSPVGKFFVVFHSILAFNEMFTSLKG